MDPDGRVATLYSSGFSQEQTSFYFHTFSLSSLTPLHSQNPIPLLLSPVHLLTKRTKNLPLISQTETISSQKILKWTRHPLCFSSIGHSIFYFNIIIIPVRFSFMYTIYSVCTLHVLNSTATVINKCFVFCGWKLFGLGYWFFLIYRTSDCRHYLSWVTPSSKSCANDKGRTGQRTHHPPAEYHQGKDEVKGIHSVWGRAKERDGTLVFMTCTTHFVSASPLSLTGKFRIRVPEWFVTQFYSLSSFLILCVTPPLRHYQRQET